MLEGDVECPDLVAFSLYDTNPFYFLYIAADKLVCNINEKEIYDKTTKKKARLQFYHNELKTFYNNYMNSVDVSDQLRNSYNFQHWMRNRNWGWALFMWGFGVMLVNAYIFYKSAHLIIWSKKKDEVVSQY